MRHINKSTIQGFYTRAKEVFKSVGPEEPDTLKLFREFQDSNLKVPDREFDATHSIYYDALEDPSELELKTEVFVTEKPNYDREEFILSYLYFLGHITLDMCVMWRRNLKSIMNEPIRELFDMSAEIINVDNFSDEFKSTVREAIKQL